MFTPGRLIFAEPSKTTPPIDLAVCNFVAVLALPFNEPVNPPVTDNGPETVPPVVGSAPISDGVGF